MAGTNTSDGKSREEIEDDIRRMRAGLKPESKHNPKPILYAILSILVVAGAAGGWFVISASGEEATVEVEDTPPVIEAPQQLAYIDLQPFFIQVETSKGQLKNVVVTLSLEVEEGSDNERRVEHELPRLYEAYLRTLTDRPLPGAADGNVDVTHIKNRIRAENLRLLGPGTVYDVILRNIWVTEG
jgi:flagellar basal body-associated protein FliL